MIDNKARLFVPLPMNPLHRHLEKDDTQSTIVTKEITLLPQISSSGLCHVPSSGRTKNLPSPSSTSDITIIEIIKPNNDSMDFMPAFARPPMQDSSLESATLMNLRPLKRSSLQQERVFSQSHMASSPSVLASSPSPVPSQQLPPQSAILSSGHGKGKVGLGHKQSPYHRSTYQQSNQEKQSPDSSFTSETYTPPDSPLLPLRISKPLAKLKVVFWVNELRRYLFLWETSRMNNAHAAELHQLLCKIEDKMADPFLTPQMLAETSLGRVMKTFTHGALDAGSKEVARRVVGYWRKVCLKA